MTKAVKRSGISLVVLLVVIQFVRPERTNPPVDESRTLFARVNTPPEIRRIFERSCNDCHSYETQWPWYSNVAPVSWLVAHDVEEGREHFSLSNFAEYKPLRAVAKLDLVCEQIDNGNMPLPKYVALHPDAKLTKEEIDLICDWVETARDSLLAAAQ